MSYHDALAQITEGPDDPDADALYEAERERRREDRMDEAEPDVDALYEAERERRHGAAVALRSGTSPPGDPLTEAVSIIQQYVEGADSSSGNPIGVHDRAVAFLRTVPSPRVECEECGEWIGPDDEPDTGGHKSQCSQYVPRSRESSEICPSCGQRKENVSWSDHPMCTNC